MPNQWPGQGRASQRARPEPTSVGGTVLLRVEHLGEKRIFLEKGEVFVVACVIAVFRPELDGNLQVFHGGIGFAGKAVERGERGMDVVRLCSGFSRLVAAPPGL